MKKSLLIVAIALVTIACKTDAQKEKKAEEKKVETKYPEAISEVFQKHGGLELWRKANTLSYTVKNEKHTIDLHSRKTLVASKNYSLGFDGQEIWLTQKDSTAFTRDPKFYYNLYFYFYAMPFVFADDGIIYSDIDPLIFEGTSYPGIKISYQSNVGTSPDDNYFIYYHPKTHQMEWLGYTVTYFNKKTSNKIKMIRYDNWENTNGLLLPKIITWYQKEETSGLLKATEKILEFSDVTINSEKMATSFYKKPTEE